MQKKIVNSPRSKSIHICKNLDKPPSPLNLNILSLTSPSLRAITYITIFKTSESNTIKKTTQAFLKGKLGILKMIRMTCGNFMILAGYSSILDLTTLFRDHFPGKLRQKWKAAAGTKFTKPGARFLVHHCKWKFKRWETVFTIIIQCLVLIKSS